MVNEKLHLIVLSSILHDIGKLFERGNIFREARSDSTYLDRCPQTPGSWSHVHSAYTGAFCDWLENRFNCLKETQHKDWKLWCSAHHRSDETGFEATVVRVSDRLSASEREEGEYYKKDIHLRTLLEPVIERLYLNKNKGLATYHRFSLAPLNTRRDTFFPITAEALDLQVMEDPEAGIPDPGQWNHLLSPNSLSGKYRELGNAFLNDIDALAKRAPDLSLESLITSLSMLLERYTSMVPSATNVRHPDISLFDHLRTTAAIAQALYLYQLEKQFPHEGLTVQDDAKWALVCGDFSGIQKFIYNLTNKGAGKGLRGRSFYVQFICKVVADFIMRQLGLTSAALLYNSGGKFFLLIPAHLTGFVLKARAKVNQWLVKEFGGEVFLGLGFAGVTQDMFYKGEMSSAWQAAALDLEKDREQRFKDTFSPEFFAPSTEFDPTKSCKVCGSRSTHGEDKCYTCKTLEAIGKDLKEIDAILTLWDEEKISGIPLRREFSLLDGQLHCFFIKDLEHKGQLLSSIDVGDGQLILLNEWGERPLSDLPLPSFAVSHMYVGKWEATKQVGEDGEPWNFDDYADNSLGIKRLGLLRMDVDNLGLIFIKGLNFPEREPIRTRNGIKEGWGEAKTNMKTGEVLRRPMASISRMVTLSRQLNHFFSGYVPTLLKQPAFDRCQIVYAGGDDLFVMGSWDQLPTLAKTIRDEFKAFCCENPDLSISAGISLQRSRYPIYKGAQLAGNAEEIAKGVKADWGLAKSRYDKDGFCFLGIPIPWDHYEFAVEIKEMLEREFEKNRGLLAFLLNTVRSNKAMAHNLVATQGLSTQEAWTQIEYGPWRWRTAYQLRRRYSNDTQRDKWASALFANKINGRQATLPLYIWLEMPLRWAEFLHR